MLIELEGVRHFVGFHIQMYVIGNIIQIYIKRKLNVDVVFADGCDTIESFAILPNPIITYGLIFVRRKRRSDTHMCLKLLYLLDEPRFCSHHESGKPRLNYTSTRSHGNP